MFNYSSFKKETIFRVNLMYSVYVFIYQRYCDLFKTKTKHR